MLKYSEGAKSRLPKGGGGGGRVHCTLRVMICTSDYDGYVQASTVGLSSNGYNPTDNF